MALVWRLGPVLTLENASSPSAVVRGVDDGLRTERRGLLQRGPGRESIWKGFELGSSPGLIPSDFLLLSLSQVVVLSVHLLTSQKGFKKEKKKEITASLCYRLRQARIGMWLCARLRTSLCFFSIVSFGFRTTSGLLSRRELLQHLLQALRRQQQSKATTTRRKPVIASAQRARVIRS